MRSWDRDSVREHCCRGTGWREPETTEAFIVIPHLASQRFGATGFTRRVPVREDGAFVWDAGGIRP